MDDFLNVTLEVGNRVQDRLGGVDVKLLDMSHAEQVIGGQVLDCTARLPNCLSQVCQKFAWVAARAIIEFLLPHARIGLLA